jgi:hypothetical protein
LPHCPWPYRVGLRRPSENPAKFYSGHGSEWASLVAGPRSAGSDGCQKIRQKRRRKLAPRPSSGTSAKLSSLCVSLPWRSSSTTFAPTPCELAPLRCEAKSCVLRGAMRRRLLCDSCARPLQKMASERVKRVGAFCAQLRSVCARREPWGGRTCAQDGLRVVGGVHLAACIALAERRLSPPPSWPVPPSV